MYNFPKVPGNPDQLQHRREFVDALRSGKYMQGSGALKTDMGMCCLGVLCDISKTGEWKRELDDMSYAYFQPNGKSCEANLFHLDMVADWAGLGEDASDNGRNLVIPYAQEAPVPSPRDTAPTCFTELNDMYGFTFAQIADIFEERFEVAPAA